MGVNLNNLNISLDQFNAVSSGKYNIGQLKLGADGASVYRTNNHKTLTFLNTTRISPEESFALKSAFCNALANEGLSLDDIEEVKNKLGIAGGAIDAVRAGGATPLSAADVRQIIDEYAGKINDKRASKASGAAALQTSGEIYRGVSQSTLASRAAVRESVNTTTVEQMMSEADNSVNKLLDMLEYTGEGETVTMSSAQKGIAQEILKRERELSMGKSIELKTTTNTSLSLGFENTVVATFRLDNGNTFSIDTGLDKGKLLEKMNNVVGGKRTSGTEKSGEASGTLTESAKKKLLTKLDNAFNRANDAEYIEELKDEARRELPTKMNPDRREAMVREKVRDKLTVVLEPLRRALKQARPFDAGNAKLVNEVRDVLSGDTKIDTKDLLKRISDALDTKIVDSREKVAKEIASGKQEDFSTWNEDKNITTLNIGDWLKQA